MRCRVVLASALTCAFACACGTDREDPVIPDWSVGVSTSPAGVAVVGVTNLAFAAQLANPRDGAVSYSWAFGDGMTAAGPAVSHVFSTEGRFDVTLTAIDTDGDSRTATVAVQVRSLSGHWTVLQNGVPGIDAVITQEGSLISGQSSNSCCTHTYSGRVSTPRVVTMVFRFSGCPKESRTFVGTATEDLSEISLMGPNCNVPRDTTFGFRRQTP